VIQSLDVSTAEEVSMNIDVIGPVVGESGLWKGS
jgi:hypothetical protein